MPTQRQMLGPRPAEAYAKSEIERTKAILINVKINYDESFFLNSIQLLIERAWEQGFSAAKYLDR